MVMYSVTCGDRWKCVTVQAKSARIITNDTDGFMPANAANMAVRMARFFARDYGECSVWFDTISSISSNSTSLFEKINPLDNSFATHSHYAKFRLSEPSCAPFYSRRPTRTVAIRNLFDAENSAVSADEVLVSGGFFLLDPAENDGSLTALGDPFGWIVANCKTISYATVARPVVMITESGCVCYARVAAEDFLYGTNGIWSQPILVRYRVDLKGSKYTNRGSGFTDFVLLNGYIGAISPGGGAEIPINGIVLRFLDSKLPEGWRLGLRIDSKMRKINEPVRFALQCGPTLLLNGEAILAEDCFVNDKFFDTEGRPALFPVRLDRGYMVGCTRPKAALAITHDGDLVWRALIPYSGQLISLFDVATDLVTLGNIASAIALDGGGTVRVNTAEGRVAGDPDDLRGLPYFIALS